MYFFYIFNWRLGTFLDAWKRSMILSIVRRYFVHFKNAHIEEKTQTAVLERLRIKEFDHYHIFTLIHIFLVKIFN